MKHIDNPDGNGRVLTMLYYLNQDWTPEHGGQLRVFGAEARDIEPLFDRAVIFHSDGRVPHAVLPAHADRYAVSLWFSDSAERNSAARVAPQSEELAAAQQEESYFMAVDVLVRSLFLEGHARLPNFQHDPAGDLGPAQRRAWVPQHPFGARAAKLVQQLGDAHPHFSGAQPSPVLCSVGQNVLIRKVPRAVLALHAIMLSPDSSLSRASITLSIPRKPPIATVTCTSGDVVALYYGREPRVQLAAELGVAGGQVLSVWFAPSEEDPLDHEAYYKSGSQEV